MADQWELIPIEPLGSTSQLLSRSTNNGTQPPPAASFLPSLSSSSSPSPYSSSALPSSASVVELLYLSYMPLSCFVGLTGNCMVWILIRSNRIYRKLPSSIYLLTLAAMSSLFLLSLLSFWFEEGFMHGGAGGGMVDYEDEMGGLTGGMRLEGQGEPITLNPHSHTRQQQQHSTQAEFHSSAVLCKCATFLAHFCDFASVWLIVCVGFERLTLLYRISLRRRSVVAAKRHVGILLIASALCNVWILFIAEVNEYGGCDIKPQYEGVYNAFSLLETGACMIVPSFIIIVSNILVVLKLRAHMKRLPASPAVSFNNSDTIYTTTAAGGGGAGGGGGGGGFTHHNYVFKWSKASKASAISCSTQLKVDEGPRGATTMMTTCGTATAGTCLLPSGPLSRTISNGMSTATAAAAASSGSGKKRNKLRYQDLQLTRSLLVVTTVFIVLNLPNYIYRTGIQFFSVSEQTDQMQRLGFIAHVLLYTHHACLFYLYIFNSPQMRKRLLPTALKLLECYCLKPNYQNYSDHTGGGGGGGG